LDSPRGLESIIVALWLAASSCWLSAASAAGCHNAPRADRDRLPGPGMERQSYARPCTATGVRNAAWL
jgi:hypothetical protein